MKITVEIDEKEIEKVVKETIVRNAIKQIENDLYGDGYGYNRRTYKEEIKSAVRSVIKENKDDLAQRAVEAAAYTISHKAIKDKIAAALDE